MKSIFSRVMLLRPQLKFVWQRSNSQHRLCETGEHLTLGFLHFSDLHHRPADIAAELDDAPFKHGFRCQQPCVEVLDIPRRSSNSFRRVEG